MSRLLYDFYPAFNPESHPRENNRDFQRGTTTPAHAPTPTPHIRRRRETLASSITRTKPPPTVSASGQDTASRRREMEEQIAMIRDVIDRNGPGHIDAPLMNNALRALQEDLHRLAPEVDDQANASDTSTTKPMTTTRRRLRRKREITLTSDKASDEEISNRGPKHTLNELSLPANKIMKINKPDSSAVMPRVLGPSLASFLPTNTQSSNPSTSTTSVGLTQARSSAIASASTLATTNLALAACLRGQKPSLERSRCSDAMSWCSSSQAINSSSSRPRARSKPTS
jgi:hypothetical protein